MDGQEFCRKIRHDVDLKRIPRRIHPDGFKTEEDITGIHNLRNCAR